MNHRFNLKIMLFASLLFSFVLICPVVHADTKVSSVLEKVVEKYKQFSAGMSVPYEREILTKSMSMLNGVGLDKASGLFFFKGPDLLKVQQETPDVEYVISNGKNVWWYVPEKKTAYRFSDMGKELAVLTTIFMGIKNPEDTFTITMAGSKAKDEYVLTLTPNESWEDIDNIKVHVSAVDYIITRIEINDMVGNLTRFRLGKFEKKNDLDNSFFDFKVPEDVKVIEEDQ